MPRTGPLPLALTALIVGLPASAAHARVALVADGGSALPLLDLATGRVERSMPLPADATAVAVSADGTVAAVAAGRHVVSFDLNARRELARRRLASAVRGIVVTPGGGRVLVAAGTRVFALDARRLTIERRAPLGGRARGLALSPQGTRAAAVLAGGRVALLRVGDGVHRTARARIDGAWGGAFDGSGRLWVSTRKGLLRVIPPGSAKPRGKAIKLGRGLGGGVAVAPGGQRIAVGAARKVGRLALVDVGSRRVRRIKVGRGPGQPSWSPDGTRIYV
ncbi:MAG: PD40 domain-containing protein, partial [Solirubrobacteraceae bacterium]|nr:PD40 domain-containing protein [Solirubrobacteraceae bacterium]